MTNGNSAAGLAVGMATGMIIGEETEKSKGRRMANRGQDQIFLKIKYSMENVGKEIASVYDNWKFKDGNIYITSNPFDVFAFIISFIVIGFLVWLVFLMLGPSLFGCQYYFNCDIPIEYWFYGIAITSALSGFITYLLCRGDDELDYIKLGMSGEYTTVLIKKFDSDGYRNLDDDDIDKIVTKLEALKR
jgi:hypothetical protein